jgi:hypothetical protein
MVKNWCIALINTMSGLLCHACIVFHSLVELLNCSCRAFLACGRSGNVDQYEGWTLISYDDKFNVIEHLAIYVVVPSPAI